MRLAMQYGCVWGYALGSPIISSDALCRTRNLPQGFGTMAPKPFAAANGDVRLAGCGNPACKPQGRKDTCLRRGT